MGGVFHQEKSVDPWGIPIFPRGDWAESSLSCGFPGLFRQARLGPIGLGDSLTHKGREMRRGRTCIYLHEHILSEGGLAKP